MKNPQAPPRPTYMRVLIGVCAADGEDAWPVVAGAMDEGTWEVIPEDEEALIWSKAKESIDPGGGYYEWRVIRVELDTAFLRHLLFSPTAKGLIKSEVLDA